MRRHPLALATAWLLTRALMLWLLAHNSQPLLGHGAVAREVWVTYHRWYEALAQGAFPADDPLWQYPPGAGPVLLSPALLPGLTYFRAFVALTLVADAVIALALTRAGTRPGRTLLGAALWILALPLLLHIPLARYDVQVTALAVISLLTLGRSTRACGVFAALGALVKVWPALVLLGTPKGRVSRSAWGWAAVSGTAVLLLLCVLFNNPLAFLLHQGERGVQIESFGGTLLGLATHVGWPGEVKYQYGAMEFTGPYVSAVAAASLALTAVAFALLLLWRLRARADAFGEAVPYDAALTAVLLFTVTSRMISPQYMVWLLGLAAVCLTSRHTTQRPVAVLLVAATAVSAVAYPGLYAEVVHSTWTGCALMVVRNGLLAAAAVLSFTRLWRTTVSVPGTDATCADGRTRSDDREAGAPSPASL
ncbi:membrane protein [Streptomyces spinoverrucosus]|uniref:Membrane protein n=1 Tax=Streptomyces spinoverrucosus TaxID=284043 RepID=A0A4Y3VV11_9ACTN|nr:glycosyltransferase family 87 protein [Streptomyces spinoverrucosus]GEC09500.1 membrane protein [Streptomyces spinoverrucosus]GHB69722.1 membrane protein [Streptomyces spinoverrucosus]